MKNNLQNFNKIEPKNRNQIPFLKNHGVFLSYKDYPSIDLKVFYNRIRYDKIYKALVFLLIFIFQLFLFASLLTKTDESIASGPNRAGINIGDHFSEAQAAINIVGPGGWIVIMAQPGDCDTLSAIISANPDINFIIRGHYPGVTNLTTELADSWAYTLANMDTGGKKVYFYPVNEPETADIIPVGSVKSYTTYLGNKLNELGLRNTKVIYLSPMLNRSHAGGSTLATWVNDLGGASYFNQFDGITMNLYDFQTECNSPLCNPNPAENARDYQNTLSVMGVNKPVYAAESGVVIPGGVDYTDLRLKSFFEAAHTTWGGELKMAAVFSYDPENEQPWSIYGTQTASLFSSLYPKCCGPEAETFDEEAFREDILQPLIEVGELVECVGCGISAGGSNDNCSQSGSTSPNMSMCGLPEVTFETARYRPTVIGIQTINGTLPWRFKGRNIDNQGSANPTISEMFSVSVPNDYEHPNQMPITVRDLGNHKTIDTAIIEIPDLPAFVAFSLPFEAGIKIPGSFNKNARDTLKPSENPSDYLKRVGLVQNDELGESPTMQAGPSKNTALFKACVQKIGDPTGFTFMLEGDIDMTQPPEQYSLSVADNFLSASLCPPGMPCENQLQRFDPITGQLADNNPINEMVNRQETNNQIAQIIQNDNNQKLNFINNNNAKEAESESDYDSSLFNPKNVSAQGTHSELSITAQYNLVNPSVIDLSYVVSLRPGTECWLGDTNTSISGGPDPSINGPEVFQNTDNWDLTPGMGAGSTIMPEIGLVDLSNGCYTLNAYTHGRWMGNGSVDWCPQEYSTSCQICLVNGTVSSSCSSGALPPRPPVDCFNCSTWAGDTCIDLPDNKIPDQGECADGSCTREVDVSGMWSCGCTLFDDDLITCASNIWNCLFADEYVLMLAPQGFTSNYTKKAQDMGLNKNFVCIPGVTTGDNLPPGMTDLCTDKPSTHKVPIMLDTLSRNITLLGTDQVRITEVEYPTYTSQVEQFCMRETLLKEPGIPFPIDTYEICKAFPFVSSTTHSSGYPGASNPYGYGVGGGVNILYEDNYFDPNLGAVTSIYDGGGRGRTNPLVDSLHVNYKWRAFQNSPNAISDFRLNELKGWVTANADAGKKSIFQIDWMSDRPNEGYEWGPDFTQESAYDPIVFSDGAKLVNYDNPNVKQQARYIISELGREFNNDPRIESVIIMDERRPVHDSVTLQGVTVNGRPVSKRIDGYNVKWGDAYGTQWVNWNKFLVDTYKQAFPSKILIANIAGGPAGVRAELVDYLVRNNVAIKNSGMVADFNNRQANPVNGLTLNVIDAQRFTMDRLLQMGEHGHMCEIPQPAYSDAWKHPPQALYWEILSLLSFGGDQLQYFSGTDSSNHMLNPSSTVVNNSIDFFKRYRNTTPSTTPSVWIALRGSEVGVEGNGAICPPTPFYPYNENYGWFMIQDDTPSDGKTKFWFSPWIPVIAIDAVNYDKYYRSTDSTVAVDGNGDPVSGKMYFKIAQGFYQSNGNNYTLKIRYKGMGTDTYKVVYKNSLGELVEKGPYTKVDNNEWFEEEVELDDVDFSPSIGFGGNSFYIDSNGDGEEFIGFVEVIPR